MINPLHDDAIVIVTGMNTKYLFVAKGLICMSAISKWHNKRLQPDTVQAIRAYIKEYGLQPNDHL